MPMVVTGANRPGDPIIFANEGFLSLSGYCSEEVLGQPPDFLAGPDTDAEVAGRLRQALAEDRDEMLEAVQYRKDGSQFMAAVALSAFRDEAGQTLHHVLSFFDVTRRGDAGEEFVRLKRTEAQLRESEERFRSLAAERDAERRRLQAVFEQAPLAIAVTGPAGEILFRNEMFDRLWGRPAHDTNAQTYSEVYEGYYLDGRPVASHEWPGSPAITEGRVTEGEVIEIVDASGRRIPCAFYAGPVRDEEGRISGGVVLFRDVTEERRSQQALIESEERLRQALLMEADEALRKSEERLRLIVENARDYAIIITDPDARIVEWLPGAEAVYGWTRDEAVGQPAAMTFTPEDRAQGVPEQEIATAAQEGSAPDVRWHQRKDGGLVFIDGTTTPLRNDDGSIRGFLKIGQDVSERRTAQEALEASERRMRSLVTGIPQLVFRSLSNGHRIWGSPQWIEYSGLSLEESLGFGWLDALHPDDRQASMNAWEGVGERGEYYVEHRIRNAATGEYRWHQTRAVPSGDEQGRLEWLGTSSDVEELRQLHRHQQTLLAELQHRVRNTLGVVRSIARRTAETSDNVEEMAMHLEGRLGAFSRVQTLVTRNPDAGVALTGLIEDELLAHAAREGEGLRIAGPDVSLKPRAAETVSLAIHELATNAVKYGALGPQEGRIDVNWRRSKQDGSEWLRLVWEENGLELPTTKPERQGFGLELLTRTLPYDLRATTEVEFRREGLRFSMALPLGPDILAE